MTGLKRWLKALVEMGGVKFFVGGYVLAGTMLDKRAGDTEPACCGYCKLAK